MNWHLVMFAVVVAVAPVYGTVSAQTAPPTFQELPSYCHSSVERISFSRSGALCATSNDRTVRVWSIDSRVPIAELSSRRFFGDTSLEVPIKLGGLQVSADERRLIVGHNTGNVEVWDLATKQRTDLLATPVVFSTSGFKPTHWWMIQRVPITAIALSPDGKRLGIALFSVVQIWDLEQKKVLRQLGQLPENEPLAFENVSLPDNVRPAEADHFWGQQLHLHGHSVQTLRRWKTSGGSGGIDIIRRIMFSPDGQFVAASDSLITRVWNLATDTEIATFRSSTAFSFSPDGSQFVTGSAHAPLVVWKLPAAEKTASIEVRATELRHLNQEYLLAALGRTLYVVRLDSGKVVWEYFPEDTTEPVEIVEVAHDGSLVAASWTGGAAVQRWRWNGRIASQ